MTVVERPSRFVQTGTERRIRVSFEFFPPKTEEMEKTLWDSITRLAPLKPNFVSFPNAPAAPPRNRTHPPWNATLPETPPVPPAHLTSSAPTATATAPATPNNAPPALPH